MNTQFRFSGSLLLSITLAAQLLVPCSLLLAQGGSLTPPGAPAPMMKTLQQVEPRTDIAELTGDATAQKIITSGGSYYLTGNLFPDVLGKDTIRVDFLAAPVTIDLNGFTLSNFTLGQSAIKLPASNAKVIIRNGTIIASGGTTNLAIGGACPNVLCENLQIISNGAAAITLGTDGVVDRCRLISGGIQALDRTIVRDSVISAAGINDVLINIVGTDAQVTGVSFTAARGQIAVGDRGLVADCQINSGGHPTFQANAAVLQTGRGAVVRNCSIAAGTTVGSAIGVGSGSLITGCRVTSAFRDGISSAAAANVTVESCAFQDFGRDGIKLAGNARVRDCTVEGSGLNDDGIELGGGSVVTGCRVSTNGGAGISVGTDSVIAHCTSVTNGSGISTSTGASVSHCSANGNGIGILVGDGSTVSHCTANNNDGTAGIQAGLGCTIYHCTARANTAVLTSSFGITTSSECQVVGCTVTNNTNTNATPTSTTGGGINVGSASTVKDCTVQGNKGDGIRATSLCQIIGNTCDGNGNGASAGDGAGIHTTSTRNRIEGNTATGNDRGIDVDSTLSLIIRNSAGNNTTNYEIAASNRYGPIVDLTAAGSAAVSGSSAASVLTNTDPNANFSH